jgi:hypothetical protein
MLNFLTLLLDGSFYAFHYASRPTIFLVLLFQHDFVLLFPSLALCALFQHYFFSFLLWLFELGLQGHLFLPPSPSPSLPGASLPHLLPACLPPSPPHQPPSSTTLQPAPNISLPPFASLFSCFSISSYPSSSSMFRNGPTLRAHGHSWGGITHEKRAYYGACSEPALERKNATPKPQTPSIVEQKKRAYTDARSRTALEEKCPLPQDPIKCRSFRPCRDYGPSGAVIDPVNKESNYLIYLGQF